MSHFAVGRLAAWPHVVSRRLRRARRFPRGAHQHCPRLRRHARDPERSTPLRHPLPLIDVADRFSACAMREARLATDWPFAPNRAYVPIPGAPSPARSSAGALSFNADESDRVLMSPFLGASLWHGSRFTRYGPSGSSHAVSRPRAQSVPNQRGVLFFNADHRH